MPTRRQNLFELLIVLLLVAGILGYFYSISITGPDKFLNPNPAGTYFYGGVPRALPPWLGVEDFTALFQSTALPTVVLLWGYFGWRSWQEGRMHPAILVMVTVTAVAVAMEPLINWGMYLLFDTRALHLPASTPWMRIAPNVEPLSCFYGYPYYFLLPALLAWWLYGRLAARTSPGSWLRRHPLWSLALLGWLTGMAFDFLVELALLRANVYLYSQVWPAISINGGKAWQFPALLAVPTIAVSMAWCAVLLHRDENRNTVADRMALRMPLLKRWPTLGAVMLSSVIGCGSYSIYTGSFAAVRALGLATQVAQPWPFEDHMIYDPDGLYEKAGNAGPFYDDQGPRAARTKPPASASISRSTDQTTTKESYP